MVEAFTANEGCFHPERSSCAGKVSENIVLPRFQWSVAAFPGRHFMRRMPVSQSMVRSLKSNQLHSSLLSAIRGKCVGVSVALRVDIHGSRSALWSCINSDTAAEIAHNPERHRAWRVFMRQFPAIRCPWVFQEIYTLSPECPDKPSSCVSKFIKNRALRHMCPTGIGVAHRRPEGAACCCGQPPHLDKRRRT